MSAIECPEMRENILMLFGADSHLMWGRSFQLAKAFASLGHNVQYVNLPLPLTRSWRSSGAPAGSSNSFSVFQPRFGMPCARVPSLAPFNRRLICAQICRQLAAQSFHPSIIWIYAPYEPWIAAKLKSIFTPRRVLYDCADDRVALTKVSEGMRAAEIVDQNERVIGDLSDCLVAITPYLARIKSHLNDRILVVPNGIDTNFFTPEARQAPTGIFGALHGPIVLYIGAVEDWVDRDLVMHAARLCPGHQFVFVGPRSVDVTAASAIPNVHFFDRRPYEEMPSVIMQSTACMIPFKNDDVTKSCDPLKVLQYIAMHKPVVSTYYEGVNDYGGLVRVAKSAEEFADHVVAATESVGQADSLAQRTDVLRRYSWEYLAASVLQDL